MRRENEKQQQQKFGEQYSMVIKWKHLVASPKSKQKQNEKAVEKNN